MARQEQFQTFETHFERVPNEILLEILSYMTHVDAVVAFANLNIRFQNLLAEWCHTFDLTSVSKKTFDIILQQKRLYRWDTLKLSDGERTPGQITYFLEQFEYSEKFSTVRSLSILNLKPNFDYSFFSQIQSLPNLLSLEMDLSNSKNIPNIQLPNLKKLRVIACGDTKWLLNCTSLERLECSLPNRSFDQEPLMWPNTIKYLKLNYEDYRHVPYIQKSLENLPILQDLELYQTSPTGSIHHGQEWADIINRSTPLLKTFQFCFQSLYRDERLNLLTNIFASYSTPFYTSEKHCFVRFDVSARHEPAIYDREYGTINYHTRHVLVYTIPFAYEVFPLFKLFSKRRIADWSRNSSYHTNRANNCVKIKTLLFKNYSTPDSMFNQSSVINLVIHTPFNSLPWTPILTKVQTLTLGEGAVLSLEDFSLLLNNLSELHSLHLRKTMLKSLTDNWTDICVCRLLSSRIRSLTLQSCNDPLQYFERNELEKMLPIFASRCENLSLGIHSHHNTLDFILRKMSNLNSLHVYMPEKNVQSATFEWLEQQHTRFNRTNCIITKSRRQLFLWLG